MNAQCATTRRRRGFTLIELIVVVGVILILASLLLVALHAAKNNGERTKIAATLQSIGTALEAYKQDFGDYPRVSGGATGGEVLGKALFALGPAVAPTAPSAWSGGTARYFVGDLVTASGNTYACIQDHTPSAALTPGNDSAASAGWVEYWIISPTPSFDGADGAGFRIRTGAAIHKGYLDATLFKFAGSYILDSTGKPVLYYPARPKVNLRNAATPAGYFSNLASPVPMYNAGDNALSLFRAVSPGTQIREFSDTAALARAQVVLGDTNCSGTITGTERAFAESVPYILWSAGPDQQFGYGNLKPAPVTTATDPSGAVNASLGKQSDDVFNFAK